jgi:hypothetical protein
MSFVETEIRRLSEVCAGFLNQNGRDSGETVGKLTSVAANRALPAIQGPVLTEKIARIEGGAEGSAEFSVFPVSAPTLLSLSGCANVGTAIATQARRGGCECRDWADGFGSPREEVAKTQKLSLLKESADLGDLDAQYRYGQRTDIPMV